MVGLTDKIKIVPVEKIDYILSKHFGFPRYTTVTKKAYLNFTLNSQHSIGETDDSKGTYTLWNFPVKDSLTNILNRNPIYFSLNIKLKENEEIEELNIKLFKEDKTKTKESALIPTELLLRVEWSNLPQESHAQPHWHIHSYKVIDELEGLNNDTKALFKEWIADEQKAYSIFQEITENNETELKEESKSTQKELPIFKFHLAMLADWHKMDGSSHHNTLTNEILSIWLPQCLRYIKDQIEYILEKMN